MRPKPTDAVEPILDKTDNEGADGNTRLDKKLAALIEFERESTLKSVN